MESRVAGHHPARLLALSATAAFCQPRTNWRQPTGRRLLSRSTETSSDELGSGGTSQQRHRTAVVSSLLPPRPNLCLINQSPRPHLGVDPLDGTSRVRRFELRHVHRLAVHRSDQCLAMWDSTWWCLAVWDSTWCTWWWCLVRWDSHVSSHPLKCLQAFQSRPQRSIENH